MKEVDGDEATNNRAVTNTKRCRAPRKAKNMKNELYYSNTNGTLFIAEEGLQTADTIALCNENLFNEAFDKLYTGKKATKKVLRKHYYMALKGFVERGYSVTIKNIGYDSSEPKTIAACDLTEGDQYNEIFHGNYVLEYKEKFILGSIIHELAHAVVDKQFHYDYDTLISIDAHCLGFQNIVKDVQSIYGLTGHEAAYIDASKYKKIQHSNKKKHK